MTRNFYLIYSADLYELPAGYFDSLDELAGFFGKTKNQMASLISKHKNNDTGTYKTPFIKTNNGRAYSVIKWTEAANQIYRHGGQKKNVCK